MLIITSPQTAEEHVYMMDFHEQVWTPEMPAILSKHLSNNYINLTILLIAETL